MSGSYEIYYISFIFYLYDRNMSIKKNKDTNFLGYFLGRFHFIINNFFSKIKQNFM